MCSQISWCGSQQARPQTARLSAGAAKSGEAVLPGRRMALPKSPAPSTPAWSWGNALGCVARRAPFGLNWTPKKLRPACRQLGYLHVNIIWPVCDCRTPVFYLIIRPEVSPDLIIPAVVSLVLSCAASGTAWAPCTRSHVAELIDTDVGYQDF